MRCGSVSRTFSNFSYFALLKPEKKSANLYLHFKHSYIQVLIHGYDLPDIQCLKQKMKNWGDAYESVLFLSSLEG